MADTQTEPADIVAVGQYLATAVGRARTVGRMLETDGRWSWAGEAHRAADILDALLRTMTENAD
jgi:hypothetical protein